MTDDYRDMLGLLLKHKVEFLVVGAHALGAHGIIRGTGDLDIWVRPDPANAQRVWTALAEFGAPMDRFVVADFVVPRMNVQLGVAPDRIDLLTRLSGLGFDEAWATRIERDILGHTVPVLGRAEMIRNKRASGRPKDIQDADDLEAGRTR